MNKQRLSEMADWLEKGAPHKHIEFNMSCFMYPKLIDQNKDATKDNICGTICCLAGCATQFYHPEAFDYRTFLDQIEYFGLAKDALDLTYRQAKDLFYPRSRCGRGFNMQDITPFWAARTIRRLMKTGKVNWDKCDPDNDAY